MGDGLLAEFGSVVDAVECAVEIQRGMAERNAGLPEDHRIDLRIGVNLGEVIVEGTDRHGEGVNIAARLEQLAEPGAICVSGKVANEVEKKLAFGFEPMGAQRVKNITEPIPVYRVKLDGVTAPPRRKAANSGLPAWPRLAAAAMVLLAGLAAVGWYGFVRSPSRSVAASHFPAIAVLPFDDLSPDKSLGYLGDGVSEDIIGMLSRFTDLSVTARQLVLRLQRQAGRHPAGRPRPERRLCSRGQRPQGGRPDPDHGAARRHQDRRACLGGALR
jgi:adenylate cyclase